MIHIILASCLCAIMFCIDFWLASYVSEIYVDNQLSIDNQLSKNFDLIDVTIVDSRIETIIKGYDQYKRNYYRPVIKYSYIYNKYKYTNDQLISPSNDQHLYRSINDAEIAVNKYINAGQVYVHRSEPYISFFEIKVRKKNPHFSISAIRNLGDFLLIFLVR